MMTIIYLILVAILLIRVFNSFSGEKSFPGRAQDFVLFAGKAVPLAPDHLDGVAGDGAVFSCIKDFIIWDDFWNGSNQLIADSLLQQAFESPILNDGSTSDYGFGWVNKTSGTHWHNGSWLGARTIIKRYPGEKEVIVLLDNSSNIRFDAIATVVFRAWEQ